MAEPADLNLDELKRRGRRRLIGAIVLALVAAVVVPMLLESEPRPLGEDVAVRIPPVDEGRYVSKLAEPRPKAEAAKPAAAAPEAETGTAAKVATSDAGKGAAPAQEAPPRKSLAEAEKAVIAPPAAGGGGAKAQDAPRTAEPAPAKSEPSPKSAPAARADGNAKPAPPREGFVVQLAAFSDDKGANALSNKLKRAGYPAYTESIATSRGALWRVRVGAYPSREAAAQARDKLKSDGHAGIVVPAK